LKIVFHTSDKSRELALAEAFLEGAKAHGHQGEIIPLQPVPAVVPGDIACMVAVKSATLFHACRAAGQRILYFDKGYVRSRRQGAPTWDYWRISLDAHHPTGTTLTRFKMPGDRLEGLELDVAKWRSRGLQIVFAGSSAKYHNFYGLEDPTTFAARVIKRLRKRTDRPLVYRPKPSWRDAVPIQNSRFSLAKERIVDVLTNAHCLVTHGSNACFEAALMGIPTIVLGDAVARPISSTSLDDVEMPFLGKRTQWLANLAYHQWTEDEMRSGEAWEMVDRWLA